jgi:hypothetical protein
MDLYFARWDNDTISIIQAENDFDAFWTLDEEGDPYAAKVWKAQGRAVITSELLRGKPGLKVSRSTEHCRWSRVKFDDYEAILRYISQP